MDHLIADPRVYCRELPNLTGATTSRFAGQTRWSDHQAAPACSARVQQMITLRLLAPLDVKHVGQSGPIFYLKSTTHIVKAAWEF